MAPLAAAARNAAPEPGRIPQRPAEQRDRAGHRVADREHPGRKAGNIAGGGETRRQPEGQDQHEGAAKAAIAPAPSTISRADEFSNPARLAVASSGIATNGTRLRPTRRLKNSIRNEAGSWPN